MAVGERSPRTDGGRAGSGAGCARSALRALWGCPPAPRKPSDSGARVTVSGPRAPERPGASSFRAAHQRIFHASAWNSLARAWLRRSRGVCSWRPRRPVARQTGPVSPVLRTRSVLAGHRPRLLTPTPLSPFTSSLPRARRRSWRRFRGVSHSGESSAALRPTPPSAPAPRFRGDVPPVVR